MQERATEQLPMESTRRMSNIELLRGVRKDALALVDAELELVTTHFQDQLDTLRRKFMLAVISAVVLLLGVFVLVLALAELVASIAGFPSWVAQAGAGIIAIGVGLLMKNWSSSELKNATQNMSDALTGPMEDIRWIAKHARKAYNN